MQITGITNLVLNTTDSLQFYLALTATVLPLLLSLLLLKLSNDNNTRHHLLAAGIITAVAITKIIWISLNPTINIGDYAIYWKHACSMASGEWNTLGNPDNPLQTIYVTRAFPYFFPIAYVFGKTQDSIAFPNLALHVMTLSVSYIFATRAISSRIALASLPLLAAYPDFWFGLTIASHDVPAMLLL
jgi:hypothetical protein